MKKTIKKSFAVLLTLLTVVCIMPISSRAVTTDIPSDAVEFNGHYYYAFDEGKTWTEAKEKCEVIGGHLVTITTQEEQEIVESIIKNGTKSCYWLGGTDETAEGQWKWITGEEFKYTHWAKDMPDNFLTENYLMMFKEPHPRRSGNTFGLWNDLKEDCTCKDTPFFRKDGFGFICEWEKKTVPSWYEFNRDSYGFRNFGTEIDKKYFYLMFGVPIGYSLWKTRHNAGGLCFGMAYTTASILNSKPSTDNLRENFLLDSPIKIGLSNMTVEDYIKYAHIYQFGIQCKLGEKKTDAKTLYDEVKKCLDRDEIGITIELRLNDNSDAHQVLAIGIDGNNILIDDPNNTYNLARLRVNDDGSWYFTGLPGWNDTNCSLSINTDFTQPYWRLSFGLANNKRSTAKVGNVTECENALLTVSNECNIGTTDIAEILAEANGENEQSTAKQYWLLSDKSVTVSSTSNGANEFSLAGSEFVVGASVNDNSEVTLTADEKNDVKIKSVEGNAYSVSFIGFGEKCEALKTEITGVANGSEVTAAKTENGVVVTGLNNLSIVYSEDDVEVGNATAEVKDGREVNITVDESKDTVKTDFVGEQTEDICGYCGKVHGTSFKEVLIKFFHRIFYFFVKLFGLKK